MRCIVYQQGCFKLPGEVPAFNQGFSSNSNLGCIDVSGCHTSSTRRHTLISGLMDNLDLLMELHIYFKSIFIDFLCNYFKGDLTIRAYNEEIALCK